MGTEREPQGSRSEFNRLTSPTSFIGERFLYIKQGIHNIREFTSQRWQDISRFNKADMGRAIAITSTFIASLTGAPFAKAETLRDGGVTGELTKVSDRYKLGFRALAEQIPTIVGEPLEDERYGSNGDSLQQTTKGLMVWRKADNWTAFTDGVDTYINGPQGLAVRPNDQRLGWEEPEVAGVQVTPTPTLPQSTPTPIPTSALTPEPKPTPTPEKAPIPTNKLYNLFEARGAVRKQFAPNEILNIGIEFRGMDFLVNDYAKKVVELIKRVPEYDTLVKRYIRSLEMGGPGIIAVNDILGDGANGISYGNQPPNQFDFARTAAEVVFNAKLTEIAISGNMVARYPYTPVAGLNPGRTDIEFWKRREIAGWEAQKQAREAEIDFARKANLFPGLAQSVQIHIRQAEAAIRILKQTQ